MKPSLYSCAMQWVKFRVFCWEHCFFLLFFFFKHQHACPKITPAQELFRMVLCSAKYFETALRFGGYMLGCRNIAPVQQAVFVFSALTLQVAQSAIILHAFSTYLMQMYCAILLSNTSLEFFATHSFGVLLLCVKCRYIYITVLLNTLCVQASAVAQNCNVAREAN